MRQSLLSLLVGLCLATSMAVAQGPPPPPPPGPLGPPPVPPQNPITPAKTNLGKALFWDEQLSSTRTVACGTCHIPSRNASDPRSVFGSLRATHPGVDETQGNADDIIGSPGVPQCDEQGLYVFEDLFGLREQVTTRKAQPAINAGYAPNLFWDGRANPQFRDPISNAVLIQANGALESQAVGPPTNSVEMGHLNRDWNDVAARIQECWPLALAPEVPAALESWINGRDYPALFAEAFGDTAVTPARIAFAIATYERTLVSNQAPIDSDTQQNPALTQLEQQGRQVFVQSDCAACHAGNRFTDDQFHYTGVRPVNDDLGRFNETGNNGDRGAMKTPGLRNVELNAPYMHNGRFASLEEVVEFYNRGGDFNAPNRDNRIRPLNLTQQQKTALLAFLRRPLTDPRVTAEQAPFDRPTLYTESNRVPRIEGNGIAGAGARTPQPMAIEPPLAGNPSFTVALTNALGGATARLVIDDTDPGAFSIPPADASFVDVSLTLDGTGAGNGHGSVSIPIPADASLLGKEYFGRWYVTDAAASGGLAVSPLIRFTIFGNADQLPAPEGENAEGETIEGELSEGEEAEGETSEVEGQLEGEDGPSHTADTNHDHRISLSEVLRCIQLFRLGTIHCADNTEDGFATGAGSMNCAPHDSDYAPQDWQISLAELLRIIQLYASGEYDDCPAGEDGFCPGL